MFLQSKTLTYKSSESSELSRLFFVYKINERTTMLLWQTTAGRYINHMSN